MQPLHPIADAPGRGSTSHGPHRATALAVLCCVWLAAHAGLTDVSHRADRNAVSVGEQPALLAAAGGPAMPTPAPHSPLLPAAAPSASTPEMAAALPASSPTPMPVAALGAAPGPSAQQFVEGAPGCKRVALLFNIGVGHEPRLDMLRVLKDGGVPATVFPMGWWADQEPAALRQIAEWGFPVGSHGDQRQPLTDRPDAAVHQDIADAAAAISAVTGSPPIPYFTPYAAATDERIQSLVAQAGYVNVGWKVPAADWDFGVTAQDVLDRVLPRVYDGAIVELHLDAPASAESTGRALPVIVERLRAEGYRFVTIPELAAPCS